MCGIAGLAGPLVEQNPRDLLARMCSLIEHRGPDDQGLAYLDNVHMGMQRLAVIDVATGQQPVYSANGDICLLYTSPSPRDRG